MISKEKKCSKNRIFYAPLLLHHGNNVSTDNLGWAKGIADHL